jgi:hypothetical protein
MLLRKVLIAILACGIAGVPARADDLTAEKRADIEQVLAMTGSLAIGKQMAATLIASITQNLRKSHPGIPQDAIDVVNSEINAVIDEHIGSLKDDLIPIYARYYTDADLKGLILFYSSALGQKMIKTMPALVQDGMIAGQKWGQALEPELDRRLTERLRQKGVDI